MDDNGGLIGWLAASWHRTMIACGIWEAICIVVALGFVGVFTVPRAVIGNPMPWTSIRRADGSREGGVWFHCKLWGLIFCTIPVLTAGIFTGWTITQWLGVHTWVLPVTVVTAALVGIGVVAYRTRGRRQRSEPAAVTAAPEVEWVTPQYDMPYGQWSSGEQVIR